MIIVVIVGNPYTSSMVPTGQISTMPRHAKALS